MSKETAAERLTEVIVASPDISFVKMRKSMRREGKLRKLAPRIYTVNLVDSAEEITRRNLIFILENLFPQAVISHRSAFEVCFLFENGDIYLTHTYTKTLSIPGYTVHLLEGPKAGKRDMPMGNLFVSGKERRMLEVLQRCRVTAGTSKTLPRASVEAYLRNLLLLLGEAALLDFRDRSQEVAAELGMESEFETLDALIVDIL